MKTKRHQQGSVLLLALVLLTAMTLGALVAMERSTLQLKMVNNMRHQQQHFNTNFGNASFAVQQMRSDNVLKTDILQVLVRAEEDSLVAGNDPGTAQINPYVAANNLPRTLARTSQPKAVKSLEGVFRVDSLPPAGGGFYAKGARGNSFNSLVYYNFRFEGDSLDADNNVRSSQARGLRLAAPSTSQN